MSVGYNSEPYKNSCTGQDAIWGVDLGEPKEPQIRWPGSPQGKRKFSGLFLSHSNASDCVSKQHNSTGLETCTQGQYIAAKARRQNVFTCRRGDSAGVMWPFAKFFDHLLLLLSTDTHFTVQQRLKGQVNLGTALRMCSLCTRHYIVEVHRLLADNRYWQYCVRSVILLQIYPNFSHFSSEM